MKKTKFMKAILLALCAALLMNVALAEDAGQLGNIPERGLILPMTQEDVDMGLETAYVVYPTSIVAELPTLDLYWNDLAGQEAALAAFSEADLQDPAKQQEIATAYYEHVYLVGRIFLFEPELRDEWESYGITPAQLTGVDSAHILGENDGYVYVAMDFVGMNTVEDAALQAKLDTAAQRAKQLMAEAAYQPIVFAEGEFSEPLNAFPAFATTDLNGNPVTNDIFAGKELTVVNVWGTYCGPCIDEMDELAAWSAAMPDNVQLIGLVSDLYRLDDAETLETAQMICEATGADVYPSLVATEDFVPLLNSLVGVPTTFFVDSTGAIVGDPIVGANVPGCQAFVEAYLNGQN